MPEDDNPIKENTVRKEGEPPFDARVLVSEFLTTLGIHAPADLITQLNSIPLDEANERFDDLLLAQDHPCCSRNIIAPHPQVPKCSPPASRVFKSLVHTAKSNALLAEVLYEQSRPPIVFQIEPESIDATPKDRAEHVRRLIDGILDDTDPGDKNEKKRKWLAWFFMYLIWWEGEFATKRKQGGKGPGRGLPQIEPITAADGLKYVLKDTKKIENLGRASGQVNGNPGTDDEKKAFEKLVSDFKKKLEAFVKAVSDGGKNKWPAKEADANMRKIEDLIRDGDSFAVKLMRYIFMWREDSEPLLPGADDLDKDPQSGAFKEHFAKLWADFWKRSFPLGDKDEQKRKFIEREKDLDKVLEN